METHLHVNLGIWDTSNGDTVFTVKKDNSRATLS